VSGERQAEPERFCPRAAGIQLGQLVKIVLGTTGGTAKLMVTEGCVRVNGETETRRGRRLKPGDLVEVDGAERPILLVAEPPA
jgi:ribosome-associated protein